MRLQGFLLVAAAGLEPCADVPPLDVVPVDLPAGPGARFPVLAAAGAETLLVWSPPSGDEPHALELARTSDPADPLGASWRTRAIELGGRGFVNWADLPAVAAGSATWLAWLERFDRGGYGARVGVLTDPAEAEAGGTGVSGKRWLHDELDGPEFGFVSLVPLEAGCLAVWLDGRGLAGPHASGSGAMQLRAAVLSAGGQRGPEFVIDERTCDCCQTDAALLDDGRVLVVWRDRDEDEVRDVAFAAGRPGEPETWSAPLRLHADGWQIAGCPVNGPAVAARDGQVAVAWYTAGGGRSTVRLALAPADTLAFGPPVQVDLGAPAGRVDVAWLGAGRGLVTWGELEPFGSGLTWHARAFALERARLPEQGAERAGETGEESRRESGGQREGVAVARLGEPVELDSVSDDRAAGFLRLLPRDAGALAAWTLPGRGLAGAWLELQEPGGSAR